MVPADTELVFVSGKVGVRPDGSTPGTVGEQADQALANIVALLQAHALEPTDIVKLTTFIVAGHDTQGVRQARQKHLGSHRPVSTAVFVSQLIEPKWFVEIEAVGPVPRAEFPRLEHCAAVVVCRRLLPAAPRRFVR